MRKRNKFLESRKRRILEDSLNQFQTTLNSDLDCSLGRSGTQYGTTQRVALGYRILLTSYGLPLNRRGRGSGGSSSGLLECVYATMIDDRDQEEESGCKRWTTADLRISCVFCFYSIRNVSDSRTRLLPSNGFVVD